MLLHEDEGAGRPTSQLTLDSLLFSFGDKVDLNIHWSLICDKVLLGYRMIAFLVLSFRYYLQIAKFKSFFLTYQYLTQFGFHLTWLYFSAVCLDYLLNQIPAVPRSPKLKQWANLLFQVSWCIEFPITILFWMILFDPNHPYDTVGMLEQIGVHGFPLFCLMVDFTMNVYQFPKRHLLVIMALAIFYAAVNCSYSLIQVPIYPPIDWVTIMSYLWIGSSVLVVVAVHTTSRLMWNKCRKNKIDKNIQKNKQRNSCSILSQNLGQ